MIDIEKEYGNPTKEFDKKLGKFGFLFRLFFFLAIMNLFTLLFLRHVIHIQSEWVFTISNITSLALIIFISITALIHHIKYKKFKKKWDKNFEEIHGRLMDEMREIAEKMKSR